MLSPPPLFRALAVVACILCAIPTLAATVPAPPSPMASMVEARRLFQGGEFEKALAEFLAITPEDDDGTGGCLEWTNYDAGRSRFVSEFRLWRDCS